MVFRATEPWGERPVVIAVAEGVGDKGGADEDVVGSEEELVHSGTSTPTPGRQPPERWRRPAPAADRKKAAGMTETG